MISVVWTLFIVTMTSSPYRVPNENADKAHLNERKLDTGAQLDDVEPIVTLLEAKKFFPEIVIELPPAVPLDPYKIPLNTGVS